MKSVTVVFVLVLFACCSENQKEKIRVADREAPLGWVYLTLYSDSTFEFLLKGLRDKDVYPGTFQLKQDTICFNYSGSIPRAGAKAIISKNYVSYIDGEYPERVEIKITNLILPKKVQNVHVSDTTKA